MAVVSTRTLIPLDRVAFHLGIDPYHFNSIYTAQRPVVSACDDDWYQYDHQSVGKISRETLGLALRQAEDMVVSYLNWTPIPDWQEETVKITQHYRPEVWSWKNSQGRDKSVITRYGYVVDVGAKASELVATPATVFLDTDGDGFSETVSITFATTVTDEEELRVYYPGTGGKDVWEIRPLTTVLFNALLGTATITFPIYMAVLWNLLARPSDPDDPHIFVDGDDTSNFLATVDVYRVYTDHTNQGLLVYEPGSTCGTDVCDYETSSACLYIRDERLGVISYRSATYDDTTGAFGATCLLGLPQKLTVYYYAGLRDLDQDMPTRQMHQTLERLITYFALSKLDQNLCGCTNTNNIWKFMTEDIGTNTRDVQHMLSWADVGNPFGTTRAAFTLWKYIQALKINRTQTVL